MYLIRTIRIILVTIILTSLNNKVVGQNLISVHSVSNSTQMNSLSPETGSIVFLESENQNYQYINGSWVSFAGNTISESSLIDSVNSYLSIDDCCPFFEVGDTLNCGVVVYTYNNGQNGTICAFNDLADMAFGCSNNTGTSQTNGLNNSNLINGVCTNSAATACINYNPCGGGGWYLPASDELMYVYNNVSLINYVLYSLNFTPLNGGISTSSFGEGVFYWSSTSTAANQASVVVMGDLISAGLNAGSGFSGAGTKEKSSIGKIRPFKQF